MTRSPRGVTLDARPRWLTAPDAKTSAGQEAIELAASAGLLLRIRGVVLLILLLALVLGVALGIILLIEIPAGSTAIKPAVSEGPAAQPGTTCPSRRRSKAG